MKPFVIVADQRTGSSLLRGSLKQHPGIVLQRGEPLDDKYRSFWNKEWFYEIYSGGVCGCTIMRHQRGEEYQDWFWHELKQLPNLVVIRLHRENMLARMASLYMMHTSLPVRLELLDVDNYICETRSGWSFADNHFEGFSILKIEYARDLLNSFSETLVKVQKFLNLDVIDLLPARKKNKMCFPNSVLNLQELREVYKDYCKPEMMNFNLL